MAATRRPQLGSQPAQAVLTSGEWAMALATRSASASAAAPSMRSSTTWVTPSPSATIWRASEVQTWVERGGKCWIAGADGGAAGAGGEQQHGVVGGGVAVDGDAVEADFDGGAQIGVEHGRLDGGVGEDVDEHGGVGHQLRMNHAGALAEGGDAHFLRISRRRRRPATSMRAKAVFSTVSVVRMAWATSWKWSDSEPSEAASAGIAAMSFSAGSGTPMTPVEEGKTSSGRQPKTSAAASQVARAASRPAWPAAQLALPALMATTRTLPPVARRCSLVDEKRRGVDAVAGEGCGGAGRGVGDDQRKVGAAARLEAGLDGAEAEAAGNDELGKVGHLVMREPI